MLDSPEVVIRQNPHLLDIWVAFHDLSRRRGSQLGFSAVQINPVTYAEIFSYCHLHAIVGGMWGNFAEHIVRMDDIYVEIVNRKLAKDAK